MFTIQVSPLSIALVKLHVVWLIFEVLFATILEFFNIWGVRLSVVVCFSANSQFIFLPVFRLRSLNSYIAHLSSIPCRNNEHDNSWTVPFRKRSTSLYVRWTYKAWFLPKVTSLNAAFYTVRRSWRAITWYVVAFSSPVSRTFYAWNAWDNDPHFSEVVVRLVNGRCHFRYT